MLWSRGRARRKTRAHRAILAPRCKLVRVIELSHRDVLDEFRFQSAAKHSRNVFKRDETGTEKGEPFLFRFVPHCLFRRPPHPSLSDPEKEYIEHCRRIPQSAYEWKDKRPRSLSHSCVFWPQSLRVFVASYPAFLRAIKPSQLL